MILFYESTFPLLENPLLGKVEQNREPRFNCRRHNGGAKPIPYLSYNGLAPPFQRWMLRVYAESQGSQASLESRTNNIPRSP